MAKKKSTTIESYSLKDGKKLYLFKFYIGTDPLIGKEKNQRAVVLKLRKKQN